LESIPHNPDIQLSKKIKLPMRKAFTLAICLLTLVLTDNLNAQSISDPSSSAENAVAYARKPSRPSPTASVLAAKENAVVEEVIDTSYLIPRIKEHIVSNYEDYMVEKAIKRSEPNGNVTYQANVSSKSGDFRLIYASDGEFIRQSDYLADLVVYLLSQAAVNSAHAEPPRK
jgi:hypothetical protein